MGRGKNRVKRQKDPCTRRGINCCIRSRHPATNKCLVMETPRHLHFPLLLSTPSRRHFSTIVLVYMSNLNPSSYLPILHFPLFSLSLLIISSLISRRFLVAKDTIPTEFFSHQSLISISRIFFVADSSRQSFRGKCGTAAYCGSSDQGAFLSHFFSLPKALRSPLASAHYGGCDSRYFKFCIISSEFFSTASISGDERFSKL